MRRAFTYLCLILFIASCKKDAPKITPPDTTPDFNIFVEVKSNAGKINTDVLLTKDGDTFKGGTAEPETRYEPRGGLCNKKRRGS
jgi:hypothetical protein